MTIAMGFMNQWHNAKFLMRTDHSRDCEAIVELVVNGFPVPPFEELLLHRLRKNGLVLLPFGREADLSTCEVSILFLCVVLYR